MGNSWSNQYNWRRVRWNSSKLYRGSIVEQILSIPWDEERLKIDKEYVLKNKIGQIRKRWLISFIETWRLRKWRVYFEA